MRSCPKFRSSSGQFLETPGVIMGENLLNFLWISTFTILSHWHLLSFQFLVQNSLLFDVFIESSFLFWFLLVTGGIAVSAVYFVASLLFMITVVYFRTGLALLKLARYSLTPFGRKWKNLAISDIVSLCNLTLPLLLETLWLVSSSFRYST